MKDLTNLNKCLANAIAFTGRAAGYTQEPIEARDLISARDLLAEASNAIDDAMGAIDELMRPERTREEMYDA